jgi:hypothetical protein
MSAILDQIGMASAVIARETDGGLEIIDGHLRADIAGDEEVPVLIVDLDETEARRLLAVFDPVGDMAMKDDAIFARLVPDLGSLLDDADLRLLLIQMHNELVAEAEKAEKPKNQHIVEGMSLEAHEHYDYIVVACNNAREFNVLCTAFDLEVIKRRGRIGTARGVRAAKVIKALGL